MKRIAAAALLASLGLAVSGQEDGRRSLFWANKALEAEIGLAGTNAVYLVVDLARKTIVFKAKGVVLREWPIAAVRSRVRVWPVTVTSVVRKKALSVPSRRMIDPHKAEEIGSYEPDALESKDMPADYFLYFEDGFILHITPKPKSLKSFILMWDLSFHLAAYDAARSFWDAIFKPRGGIVIARLASDEDARTLCWSISNGMKGLVIANED